jgi:glucokinase
MDSPAHSESLVLGVEIGGTKLQAALGTRNGEIARLRTERARPEAGAEGIRGQIEVLVGNLIDSASGARPQSIGVGFGGPVDAESGTVLVSHQVEGWREFPLRAWFEERFGLPCRVENDSNAAGWAEFRCGAGRDCRNMIYMNIGSGIGGAVILDGRLYNGQGRGAGEIGHTWVPNQWPSFLAAHSAAGVSGGGEEAPFDKLEHLCSGWSIERRLARAMDAIVEGAPLAALTEGDPARVTGPVLAKAIERGDALALEALDTASGMLGLAMANAITLLHPERFIVGGGFAQLGKPLFERLRKVADKHVIEPFRGRYEILPAALGQDVVVVGALLIAP